MAIIRDVMPAFELVQPTNVDDAMALLDQHGTDAWVFAGGLDSLDWFKDRVKTPKVVVSLSAVDELKQIRSNQDGLEIGAMATLVDVINHPEVKSGYPILADAARAAASPQIRNQGTIGGNVAQDTRCWYYRSGWPCYRAGGNTCYAAAPQAMNREHAIMGTSRCVAINPSDTAPALVALDAKMIVRGRRGSGAYNAEDFFIGPATDITRMTVLESGDLLTQINIPEEWANEHFYYEKVRDRGSWDFQLVSVASAFKTSGNTIDDARIVVNGVAPFPVRLDAVERLVRGASVDEEIAVEAGEIAIQGSRALKHNEYKQPMMSNLVRRAVRSVA